MKKVLKKVVVFTFFVLTAFFVVSCQQTSINNTTTDEKDYFTVSVLPCSNGAVKVDASQAKYGEMVNITLIPNDRYHVLTVAIRYGDNLRYLSVKDNNAAFKMPASDVSLYVEFIYDKREVVDYLILGDSYTDIDGWQDFYSDMRDLPSVKTIGVGGTTVPQWGKSGTVFGNRNEPTGGMDNEVMRYDGKIIKTDILGNYYVNNFVFHLGVNDIKSGVPANTVISDLMILFEQYHREYPNAHIYWISLSLNVSHKEYTEEYKKVNEAIKKYADECEYLTYINTVDTMFPDGKPNSDWFVDGLHFNPDGYATWSALITEALGYPRADVDEFGSADIYYSSNTWNYDPATQTISNEIRGDYSEQSLWFDGVFDVDMYAEMEVTVTKLENGDDWPKFGMAVNGNGNHVWFYVEATKNLTGKTVNYTERRPYANRYVACESSTWDWGIQGEWINVPSLNYTNGNFVKLGLLRCGSDMYFFVNDKLVFTKGGFISCDAEMAIGLTLTNLNVVVRNYSVTTDVDEIIKKFNIQNAPDAHFEGVKSPNFTNNTQSGEVIKKVANFSKSEFYFETVMSANYALNVSNSSKKGICLQSNGNELMFYIDSEKNAGVVFRSSGGNWNWQDKIEINVSSLLGTNFSSTKLAVYKDDARLVFMINDNVAFEISNNPNFAGNANVGVVGLNTAFTVSNSKISTSKTMLNLIKSRVDFD